MTRSWQAVAFLLVIVAAIAGAFVALRLATRVSLPNSTQVVAAAQTAVLGQPAGGGVATVTRLPMATTVRVAATVGPSPTHQVATPEIPTPQPTVPEPTTIRTTVVPALTSLLATDQAGTQVVVTQTISGTVVVVTAAITETVQPGETPQTQTPTAITAGSGDFEYVLAAEVRNDNTCAGEYIRGVVRDRQGNSLPNVRLWLRDQWGNEQRAVSKSGANDLGQYDFPIAGAANIFFLNVVDAGSGRPISPRITILHHQANAPDAKASCHWVDWRKR